MFRTLTLALALTLAACHKQVPAENAGGVEGGVAAPAATKAPDAVVADMKETFQKVHFETDSSDLDADSKAALNHNADLMKKHAGLSVEIQGHADERGTTDYNLALGQRRAQAVYDYLSLVGVPKNQLSTVSFGEEKPVAEAHSEVAWSQNRRAEFRIRNGGGDVSGTVQ